MLVEALLTLFLASPAPQPKPSQQPAVVFVLNTPYIEIFNNFIRAPGVQSIHRDWDVHLICTDSQVGMLVTRNPGWSCRIELHTSRDVVEVFTKRIPYVVSLVLAGRDVLISDLDALWMQGPQPMLLREHAQIVMTRDYAPWSARKAWGAAACMGFIFFRGSDPKMQAAIVPLTTPMKNDQADFNKNLAREHLQWNHRLLYTRSRLVDRGTLRTMNTTYAGLKVAMMPHTLFVRQCEGGVNFSKVVIAHCRNHGKNGDVKRRMLEALGLWFIPREGGSRLPLVLTNSTMQQKKSNPSEGLGTYQEETSEPGP